MLNDSKIAFARRRWLQTNLGGPKLLTASGYAPPAFAAAQLLLWLLPIAIGVPLSLTLHTASSSWVPPIIAAAAMLLIHSSLQLARHLGGSRS